MKENVPGNKACKDGAVKVKHKNDVIVHRKISFPEKRSRNWEAALSLLHCVDNTEKKSERKIVKQVLKISLSRWKQMVTRVS